MGRAVISGRKEKLRLGASLSDNLSQGGQKFIHFSWEEIPNVAIANFFAFPSV